MRFPQSKFRSQPIDIFVDSGDPSFYMGIECKSIKRSGNRSLSVRDQFTRKSTGDQFIAETKYLKLSGRRGFVLCEIWGSRGNSAHAIPWEDAIKRFCDDDKPFKQEEIAVYPGPVREPGKYRIDDFTDIFPDDRNI